MLSSIGFAEDTQVQSPQANTQTQSNTSTIPIQKAKEINTMEVDTTRNLRPRSKIMTWKYNGSNTVFSTSKNNESSKSSQRDKVDLDMEVGRNFGSFQFSILLSYFSSVDIDSDEVKTKTRFSGTGIGLRYNIIENTVGNDFIPYTKIGIFNIKGSSKTDNESTIDITGSASGLGLGFDWFPFSEIFAVNLEFSTINSNVLYSSNPNKIDSKNISDQLSIGFGLYF